MSWVPQCNGLLYPSSYYFVTRPMGWWETCSEPDIDKILTSDRGFARSSGSQSAVLPVVQRICPSQLIIARAVHQDFSTSDTRQLPVPRREPSCAPKTARTRRVHFVVRLSWPALTTAEAVISRDQIIKSSRPSSTLQNRCERGRCLNALPL